MPRYIFYTKISLGKDVKFFDYVYIETYFTKNECFWLVLIALVLFINL